MGMWHDALSMLPGFAGSLLPRLPLRNRSTMRESLTVVFFQTLQLVHSECSIGIGDTYAKDHHTPGCDLTVAPAQAARRPSYSSSYMCELPRCWRHKITQLWTGTCDILRKVSMSPHQFAREGCA